jgi:hypothetical protein
MAEVRIPVTDDDIPSDCEIYEIFIDGKSVGFVVIGPDGVEHWTDSKDKALGIAAEVTKVKPLPKP